MGRPTWRSTRPRTCRASVPRAGLVGVPGRADPADAYVGEARRSTTCPRAPVSAPRACAGARSSWRCGRTCELVELHGNVDTRLRRLSEGEFDGVVLAVAGLAPAGPRGRGRLQLRAGGDDAGRRPGIAGAGGAPRGFEAARVPRWDLGSRCADGADGRARRGRGARRHLPHASRDLRPARGRRAGSARLLRPSGRLRVGPRPGRAAIPSSPRRSGGRWPSACSPPGAGEMLRAFRGARLMAARPGVVYLVGRGARAIRA